MGIISYSFQSQLADNIRTLNLTRDKVEQSEAKLETKKQ
jgi:hypothetical protein